MTIDWWTLGLQTVNVAVLVWLLARFFWRPVSAMIAERQVAAGKELAEAAARQAEAEKALADIAATRAGLAKEREALLVAAAAEADKERAARLEKATREIAALHDAAKAAVTKEREAALASWRGHAATLAVEIAARLLKRLDGAAVRKAFLDELLHEIGGLTQAQRGDLAGGALELVSAVPLTDAEQAQCRAGLAQALGPDLQLAFTVDAAQIAGFVLRGPRLAVSDSWRGDLDRILAELGDDA